MDERVGAAIFVAIALIPAVLLVVFRRQYIAYIRKETEAKRGRVGPVRRLIVNGIDERVVVIMAVFWAVIVITASIWVITEPPTQI